MKTGRVVHQADELLSVVVASDSDFEARFQAWASSVDIDDHNDVQYELLGFLYLRLEQCSVEFVDRQRLAGVKRHHWSQHQMHSAAWRKATSVLAQSGIDVLEPAELAIRRSLPSKEASTIPGGPLPVIVHSSDFVNAKRLTDSSEVKVVDHAWGSPLVTNEVWRAGTVEGGITLLSKDHAFLAAALWRGNGPQSVLYRVLTNAFGGVAPLDVREVFSVQALADLDERMRPRLSELPLTNWPSGAVLAPMRLLVRLEDSGTAVARKLWRSLPLRVRTPLSPALNALKRLLPSVTGRQ